LICRQGIDGPVEQFVNVVPIAAELVGNAWRFTIFSGTCASFWKERDQSTIWWAPEPSNTLPGTRITFIAHEGALRRSENGSARTRQLRRVAPIHIAQYQLTEGGLTTP
jgi:hypothetical protein